MCGESRPGTSRSWPPAARLEAHKRAGCETVLARAIYGDTPEIACAVEAIEIEENLHRRELSPALRKTYTTRLKALHEQEHPKSKGGRPSKTVPKAGKVSKPERFTKAHAKRTGRSEAAVQQDVAEATALGDDVMKKIVGTSLDTPSEITAGRDGRTGACADHRARRC